jgi:transposase-like protein
MLSLLSLPNVGDMNCPHCNSVQCIKNGHRKGRQCYKCKACGRQFLESYRPWRYSDDVRDLCLKMYLKNMSLREIEQLTDIHHTTIMHWVRAAELGVHDPLKLLDPAELEESTELSL